MGWQSWRAAARRRITTGRRVWARGRQWAPSEPPRAPAPPKSPVRLRPRARPARGTWLKSKAWRSSWRAPGGGTRASRPRSTLCISRRKWPRGSRGWRRRATKWLCGSMRGCGGSSCMAWYGCLSTSHSGIPGLRLCGKRRSGRGEGTAIPHPWAEASLPIPVKMFSKEKDNNIIKHRFHWNTKYFLRRFSARFRQSCYWWIAPRVSGRFRQPLQSREDPGRTKSGKQGFRFLLIKLQQYHTTNAATKTDSFDKFSWLLQSCICWRIAFRASESFHPETKTQKKMQEWRTQGRSRYPRRNSDRQKECNYIGDSEKKKNLCIKSTAWNTMKLQGGNSQGTYIPPNVCNSESLNGGLTGSSFLKSYWPPKYYHQEASYAHSKNATQAPKIFWVSQW